jgi:hypothetical protein
MSQPPTEIIESEEARRNWGEVIRRVSTHEAEIVVRDQHDRRVAIVATDELARLRQLDQQRAEHFRILNTIGEAFQHESAAEAERIAKLAVKEAREAYRDRRPNQA